MDNAEKISRALDLSLYEAKVYIALQKEGPLLVRTISKYAGIPRTAVYSPLDSLLGKGFASKTLFGKRKYYSAVPPEQLLFFLEERKDILTQAVTELSESRKIQSEKNDFETKFYSGEHGIKSAGLEFLQNTKGETWFSFENIELITKNVGFEFEDFYIRERVKRNIKSKAIISFGNDSTFIKNIVKNNERELRKTVLLSPSLYPFKTTIVATRGLALLVNPNENPFALLIRNEYLADTFITLHECLWDKYTN